MSQEIHINYYFKYTYDENAPYSSKWYKDGTEITDTR